MRVEHIPLKKKEKEQKSAILSDVQITDAEWSAVNA